jgi:ligand-binding SRPBCC domain-containing protein
VARFETITIIHNAPAIVFDLSRSIDLHILSTGKTNEKAVAGVTTGLIELGERVTWQAYHLFKNRRFTSVITAFDYPFSFTDEMVAGDLKSFSHRHIFEEHSDGTLMKDEVTLEAPFGFFGKIIMAFFLRNYFRKFLVERNVVIKKYAENGEAAMILKNIAH